MNPQAASGVTATGKKRGRDSSPLPPSNHNTLQRYSQLRVARDVKETLLRVFPTRYVLSITPPLLIKSLHTITSSHVPYTHQNKCY